MKRARSESGRHADVIGTGVLGTFHAYYAAQMGLKTLLLERNLFPSDASTRNFGMVIESIVEANSEWPAFARASRETYAHDYGIHLLFRQALDGPVIIGDSHEYRAVQDANAGEESTNCLINEAILQYARQMITLPSWHIQRMWNGYYLIHPQREVYTETIDGIIHIVTGIAGNGMSTGPGFARKHICSLLA